MKAILAVGTIKRNAEGVVDRKIKINDLCISCGVRPAKGLGLCPTCAERIEKKAKKV